MLLSWILLQWQVNSISKLILELANMLGIEVDKFSELSPVLTDEYMMYQILNIMFSFIREVGVFCFFTFIAIRISVLVDSCSKDHKRFFIMIGNKLGLSGSILISVAMIGHIVTKMLSPNINLLINIIK